MQDNIALSSGEAELKATCKGLTEGLGLRELVVFLMQTECVLEHWTDASACVGMLRRAGAGRVKHLTVRQLWCPAIFKISPHKHWQDSTTSKSCGLTLQ